MAYASVAAYNQGTTPGATSHVISMPAGIIAGNLLFVIFATDGDNTVTNWGGFTQLYSASNGTASSLHLAYKIAVGSDTLTITTSEKEEGSYVIFRIIDHGSATNPPEVSAGATGSDNSPNPDRITMLLSKDYMFIACEGSDHLDTVTAYPSTHGQNRYTQNGGAAGSCGVGVATREYTGTVDDPGVFTLAAGEEWVACTVAIYPVGEQFTASSSSVTQSSEDIGSIDGAVKQSIENFQSSQSNVAGSTEGLLSSQTSVSQSDEDMDMGNSTVRTSLEVLSSDVSSVMESIEGFQSGNSGVMGSVEAMVSCYSSVVESLETEGGGGDEKLLSGDVVGIPPGFHGGNIVAVRRRDD